MLNKEPSARQFKDEAYGAFAAVVKAMGNPRRLEVLDLLVQRPLRVDAVAAGVGQSVANTSQHLQVLRRAGLVVRRARGTSAVYAVAVGVPEALVALRRLAEARSAELLAAKQAYFGGAGSAEVIAADALREGLEAGDVVLVDVRPAEEFADGHVPGARSLPVGELGDRLHELPTSKLIVATCRGPYCTFAADAVRVLRASGRRAVRFEHGVAEWRADGGEVV